MRKHDCKVFLLLSVILASQLVYTNSGDAPEDHANHGHGTDGGASAGGTNDASAGEASSSVIPKAILAHKWSYHHQKTGEPVTKRDVYFCDVTAKSICSSYINDDISKKRGWRNTVLYSIFSNNIFIGQYVVNV